MLQDLILIFGCLFVGFGILRSLSLVVDKTSPLRGILIALIGCGFVYSVYLSSEKELTFQDVPDAMFRVIGELM